MEENILSKIISRTLLCLSLILVCGVGAIAAEYTAVVPFAFTAIYGCSYIFWKANNGRFPYYFHIGLLFLIASNQAGGVESTVSIVKWGLIAMLIVLAISFVKLHKKQMPMFSRENIIQGMIQKYKTFFNENSQIMPKLLAHCLIVFVVSWIAYFVYDHRGYWIIVSAAAVLIGGEYGRISVRGKRRIVGAFVSAIGVGALVFFDANTAVLVCVAIATFVGINFFMPRKYIMGSACIGMHATVCNILASGDLSYNIVAERVIWTILGAILALSLCFVLDKVIPSLYENYTKEKLIVARK